MRFKRPSQVQVELVQPRRKLGGSERITGMLANDEVLETLANRRRKCREISDYIQPLPVAVHLQRKGVRQPMYPRDVARAAGLPGRGDPQHFVRRIDGSDRLKVQRQAARDLPSTTTEVQQLVVTWADVE